MVGLTSTVTAIGENRGNVWARLVAPKPEPGARPLVLLHHIDVVPHEPARWEQPAFSGALKDGLIYGRGAIDIKGQGVLQLAALERLIAQKERLKRDVIYLAVSDEEAAGLGAQKAVELQLKEWNPEYLLDEGGFSIRKFINNKDLMVIATTQKRVCKIRIIAEGQAGHGSRPVPDGGPSVLMRALHKLDKNPPQARLTPTTQKTFAHFGVMLGFPVGPLVSRISWPGMLTLLSPTLSANKNINPMLRDTVALTMLEAGQKINVIPARASADFDVRLMPQTKVDDLVKELQAIVDDPKIRFEILMRPLPPYAPSSTDDPLYRSLVDAARAHEPQSAVAPWLMVGANDSRFFAPKGVKTYGFMPVYVSKSQIDTIHGHNENVSLKEFQKGMVVYAEALERFLLRDN